MCELFIDSMLLPDSSQRDVACEIMRLSLQPITSATYLLGEVVLMPCRNEPHVHIHKEESNPLKWHGAELSVTILGNWQYYRAKVLRYMRQIAVITPYAQFRFHYKAEDDKNSLDVTFVRRTDKMPPPPKAGSGFLPASCQYTCSCAVPSNSGVLAAHSSLAVPDALTQQPAFKGCLAVCIPSLHPHLASQA